MAGSGAGIPLPLASVKVANIFGNSDQYGCASAFIIGPAVGLTNRRRLGSPYRVFAWRPEQRGPAPIAAQTRLRTGLGQRAFAAGHASHRNDTPSRSFAPRTIPPSTH
jgi:hypothetical protein